MRGNHCQTRFIRSLERLRNLFTAARFGHLRCIRHVSTNILATLTIARLSRPSKSRMHIARFRHLRVEAEVLAKKD
jgi:hypothetical protein